MYAIPDIVRFDKIKSSKEIGIQKASSEKGEELAKQAIKGTIAAMLNLKEK